MGEMEQKIANRARREQIQQKIATVLFRLTTQNARAVFAPEAVLRARLFPESSSNRTVTRRLWQALRRLEKKGMVEWGDGVRGRRIALTEKGKTYAKTLYTAERIHIRKPRVWDQKWRIVIFDVWERRRQVRDKLRRTLEKAGFRRIQDSVWVCPYDCEELVAFLKADLRLGDGLLYLVAEGVENDAALRRRFGL